MSVRLQVYAQKHNLKCAMTKYLRCLRPQKLTERWGGGGYSSPFLCVPQLASPLFYQLPALRCKTRQNECHGIESPTFFSFLRKLSKSEKIIPGVVLVKLSAEQRNKWRKSPPFTTIFPYQYNRDSCREFEERQKNHGSLLQRFFLS